MVNLDPSTELIFGAVAMLMVGSMLGLMHTRLSLDTQASAGDWRLGTLLTAGGAIRQPFAQWLHAELDF